MSSEPPPVAFKAATPHEWFSSNRHALATAAEQIARLEATLKNLEASTRGVGLRETSKASLGDEPEASREQLSRLQLEANTDFAEMRRALADMRENLRLLESLNEHVTAAARAIEEETN